ncbi:MAG TPA: ABC transporter substrate-binding protein [Pedococcus sp.]
MRVRLPVPVRSVAPAARRRAGALALAAATVAAGSCTAGPLAPVESDGTLTVVSLGPVLTWDPQRMSSAKDMAVAGRLFTRTLTAYPPGADSASQRKLVGDLATDTGRASKDLRTWSFTLREGARWQDGSAVTCEDVRHGVARTFAEPAASEGLRYPMAVLDIPRKADGTSTYAGPYGSAGKAGFDKAVTCKGSTVTFRLSQPRADFDQMVSLSSFAPFKKAKDTRGKATHAVFSNGPYQLQGQWDEATGGTLVRNPHWSRDADPVRRALPERIRYQQGVEWQTAAQHILSDDDENATAVALDSAPPAMQHSIVGSDALRRRSLNPRTALMDYLVPNVRRGPMATDDARRALAVATNRDGYVSALGGSTAADPSYTLIGPNVPGHRDHDPLGGGTRGNPVAARTLLQESGFTLPVPLRVAYRSTPTADKAMAALRNGWEAGGFEVTLQPIGDDYFAEVGKPERTSKTDVVWATWAPAWPSASTIIPPLFDSRINLTSAGSGRDYGRFADPKVDEQITTIATIADDAKRDKAWADLDARLASRGVYVALAQRKALYVAGSRVTGLAANDALGGFVDLGGVGVK